RGPLKQVAQALHELGVGQLIDIALKREVDETPAVVDTGVALDAAHTLGADAPDQLALDLRLSKMKEVARVIPDEAVLDHAAAIAPELRLGLADHVLLLLETAGEGEAGDTATDDQKARFLHRYLGPSHSAPGRRSG